MTPREIQRLLDDLGYMDVAPVDARKARDLIVSLIRERDYEEAMAWKQLNDLMADQMLRVVR